MGIDDAAERLQAVFVDDLLGGEHQHRGTVRHLRAVAAVTLPYVRSKTGFSFASRSMLESRRTPSSAA
jgi:hypothetical protein